MMTNNNLKSLCQAWQTWSISANKEEDGWPSDFPDWDLLIKIANATMLQPKWDDTTYACMVLCWQISEETEIIADFTANNLTQCIDKLEKLANSDKPQVRWQVYACLINSKGTTVNHLLRKGIHDLDSYARRRALISLAKLEPSDAIEIASQLITDNDPYIRQVSIEFLRSNVSGSRQRKMLSVLANDPVEHVRNSALSLIK